jgi:hypothetical protein
MSKKRLIEIECPKCKINVNITLWSSLNAQVDPEAKRDLLQGKINIFQCPDCNFETPVVTPFLYHDIESKFYVQYYPFKNLEDENFFDYFLLNGKLYIPYTLPEEVRYIEDTHIVFSMEELIRYVIFRDKLTEAKKNSK